MSETTLYFGTTQTGVRIHMGTNVWYQEDHDRYVCDTLCGYRMTTHSLDRPFPAKVVEFCKTCFRSEAWGIYTNHMLGLAEAKPKAKRRLRAV